MRGALLADANVVIDYVRARRHVLALVSRHVAPVKILRDVLTSEVGEIDERGCVRLGIEVIGVSPAIAAAASAPIAGLSFNDRLCLVTARGLGWACLTNDKPLRGACKRAGGPVMWGLDLLVHLHARGKLTRSDACRIAERLHQRDPHHFPLLLIERLVKKVRAQRR